MCRLVRCDGGSVGALELPVCRRMLGPGKLTVPQSRLDASTHGAFHVWLGGEQNS
jgi:hypothetical protein